MFGQLIKRGSVDVTAWNGIMAAHMLQGDWKGSHRLFVSMLEQNVPPDAITFTQLLTAASHSGDVDNALTLYHEMESKYGMVPNVMHQTVLVDALTRSGRLQEAHNFIETSIDKPSIHEIHKLTKTSLRNVDIVTWRTLLAGCRYHGNVEWAEFAAYAAWAIDPNSAPIYVMLSNVYPNGVMVAE